MRINSSTIISNLRLAAGRWFMTIVLLCAAATRAAEPTFTNVTSTVTPGLPQVGASSVAWGDYDNDGRLDFLITGASVHNNDPVSQLWRNTESGFVNVAASVVPGLPGVRAGSVAWADFDGDGHLDFLITGTSDHDLISQLWRNTGTGFVNVTATLAPGLPGVSGGSVAWGDFDDDGRLDFVITGERMDTSEPVAQLWRNTGSGFMNVTTSLAPDLRGVLYSSVAWGDYNNDGRLDFLLTGGVSGSDSGYDPVSQLWRNSGNGFTNVTATIAPSLPGVWSSSVAWGDYDNDGRLDFLLTGYCYDAFSYISQLWRNTGSWFTDVTASVAPGLPGVSSSSVAWGDYDNDGRLDFLLTGYNDESYISQVWRNTGSGFTNVTADIAPALPGFTSSSVAWGDSDDDGRLDFLITGTTNFSESGGVSQLWQNNTEQSYSLPAVLTDRPDAASHASAALSARINPHGQTATAWFIWGDSRNYGQATAAQHMGNGGSFASFSQSITGLIPGVTYYYRAVGSNDQGRVVLGVEQRFLLAAPGVTTSPASVNPTSATLNGHANPNNVPTHGWFEWGLTPDYGHATTVQFLGGGFGYSFSQNISSLPVGTTYYFRAVVSNSLGIAYGAAQSLLTSMFADVTAAVAPGLPWGSGASVAWGDYDNDGRLDFFVTGGASQIWRNTGSGFTNVTAIVAPGLPQLSSSTAAWGDYDNDGWLDFILTGYINNNNVFGSSQIWRNTGSGFENVTSTVAPGLPRAYSSSVAWGDYDNDGRLDILLTGDSYLGIISQIWRNTGSGFMNVTATVAPSLPPAWLSSVAWGDYDNDGRLDFLLTGYTSDLGDPVSQLWQNTGSTFTNVTATVVPGLPEICQGSVAWGDYDNDGRLDFLITGATKSSYLDPISQLWRNTGSGFTNVTATVAPGLPEVFGGSTAWGDYDNDGRLDFLLTGYNADTGTDYSMSQVWRNTGSGFINVTATVAPSLPRAGDSVTWGDYDNDGRLDFLLTGYDTDAGGSIFQLWRNHTPLTNTPPSAVTGLAMTASGNAVMLSWNSATDGQTPASGLTYNVRAGTTPGGNDLLSAHVNATNGFRRVPAMGNAMLRHSLPLIGLTNGQTVYWSVQAVDTSFAGGPFASETSVVSLPQLHITRPDTTNAIVSWAPPTFGWVLQQSSFLNASNWANTSSGPANPTTLPTTNGNQFYRLFKP